MRLRVTMALCLSVSCLLGPVFGASAARAQDGQAEPSEAADFFSIADQDGDGVLQPAEYEKVSLGFSHEEMAGQDGRIERGDYLKAFADSVYVSEESLALLDLDDSGSLSRQEHQESSLEQEFEGIDVNGDDEINAVELSRSLAWIDGRKTRRGSQASSAAAPSAAEQAEQQVQSLEARVRADVSQFSGMPVKNAQGELVGEVADMVQDASEGQLFAIINPRNTDLEKVALPLRQLQGNEGELLLDVANSAALMRQHVYDEQAFEALDQPHTQPPAPEADASLTGQARVKPGQLNGRRILLDGETVGNVEQVLMIREGEDLYVRTSSDRFGQTGPQVVIGLKALEQDGDDLVLQDQASVQAYREEDFLVVQEPDIPAAQE